MALAVASHDSLTVTDLTSVSFIDILLSYDIIGTYKKFSAKADFVLDFIVLSVSFWKSALA